MTCIVGMKDKKFPNYVTIGGDSAESNGSNIFIRKDGKVFKNGKFIIGCTSSFRMIQLLKFSFIPPEIGTKDIFEYMCTDFVNSVRECFKNGGYLQIDESGSELGGSFLVGYKDRLFKIENDFQVAENVNGIDAVGCGAVFALGALIALSDDNILSDFKIIKALEIAEYCSVGVRGPFTIFNTNI